MIPGPLSPRSTPGGSGPLAAQKWCPYSPLPTDIPDERGTVAALSRDEVAAPLCDSSRAPADTSEALAPEESDAAITAVAGISGLGSTPPAPADIPPESSKEKSTYWMAKRPATRKQQRLSYQMAQEFIQHKRQCHQQALARRVKSKRRSSERARQPGGRNDDSNAAT
jgi:hypothetical protein